ncbi:MAG: sodium:solute symporter [Pirellulaceae bacterium]
MVLVDWLVVAAYFALLGGVAVWVVRQKQDSSADYFLAGRNQGWFVVGASLFASNIGSEHLVGLAGAGASSGVAMAHYELHAWCLLVLGWVLVPFYARSAVYTMPEFLERRYSPAARWFLSLVSLVGYVFTKVAVGLFAGGIVVQVLFPEQFLPGINNFWLGAVGIVVVTGLYTVFGGLRAVIYTDAVQAVVLIVGSAVMAFRGLYILGGWGELQEVCGSQFFNLWRPWDDPAFPWLGMLVAAPIVGMWYWCTDQYIVQRTLAARDQGQGRRGTIFGAYLKLSPVFLFIIPGMIAYALIQTGKIPALEDPNQAYPALVHALLPLGLRGLVAASLLAALMSSLSSVFNSSSTLFTMDLYKPLHPEASERTLVWVGRLATTVMVVLGLAWIPFISMISDALYHYLQSVQAYIAPPIFAVFFLGVFSRRINAAGCMAGLVSGFVLGMARLAAEVSKRFITEGTFLYAFANLNFLYFCLALLGVVLVVIVGVSYATAPPPAEKLRGLTYWTLSEENRRTTRASWNRWDVIHTCAILVIILLVYLYFSPIFH